MPPPQNQGHRINEQIRISPVRLIDAEGQPLGVVPTLQAMEKAREAGMDLVEVAPNERPPVCKILDYGKFRYEQSRKANKSKVHQQKLKEVRVRPKTGDHDVDVKINAVRKFLERTPVSFPIGLAGLGGTELGKSLGNSGGGLPFTVVIGADGSVMQRKMGKVSPEDLQSWHAAT